MSTDGPVWRSVADCPEPSIACQVSRIADSMSGFDWNAFWATLLATIVGAIVAALIGLYVARLERPQPYFRVDAAVPEDRSSWGPDAHAIVMLSNTGDGPAYDVSLTLSGGIAVGETVRAPRLDSGAVLSLTVAITMSGRLHIDPVNLTMLDERTVHWPERGLHASIRWQQPPRRRHPRLRSIPVANPFAGTQWDSEDEASDPGNKPAP